MGCDTNKIMGEITSRHNSKLKYCAKLTNSVKFRYNEKLFVIEGLRLCEEAVYNNVEIDSIFVTQVFLDKNPRVASVLLERGKKIYFVQEHILKDISCTQTSQGILCICKMPDKLDLTKNVQNLHDSNILGLEDIQDPSNLGAILRTAAAFNFKNIVITKSSCDPYSPKNLRASMGSLFKIKLFFVNSMLDIIKYMQKNSIKTYAAVVEKSATDVRDIDFNNNKNFVIVGNEGNGLKKETIDLCDACLTIPMDVKTESLNVAVSSGILLWEMVRYYFARG